MSSKPENRRKQLAFPSITRDPELYIALAIAVAVMAGVLMLSRVLYIIDLPALRQTVETFFSLTVTAPPESGGKEVAGKQTLAGARDALLRDERGGLFTKPPAPGSEKPQGQPAPPSEIPTKPQPLQSFVPDARPAGELHGAEAGELKGLRIFQPDKAPAKRAAGSGAALPAPDLGRIYSSGQKGGGGEQPATKPESLFTSPKSGDTPTIPATLPPTAPENPAIRLAAEAGAGESLPIQADQAKHYPSLDKEINADFAVYKELATGERYFKLTLTLRPDAATPPLPKDVLLLVDVSNSIEQANLSAEREGVLSYLAGLRKGDRWNVAVFSEKVHLFAGDFISAEDFPNYAEKLRNFINRQGEEQMTDIFAAAHDLILGLPDNNRLRHVFLISDGKPTTGISDVRYIVRDFQRGSRDDTSVFTFDPGTLENHYLLELLAYRSRGWHGQADSAGKAAAAFVATAFRFEEPVLAKVMANYTNLTVEEVYPEVLPNLFRNQPIEIVGKCKSGATIAMRVAGHTALGPREFFFRAQVPDGDTLHPEIARDWAQGKAHALMAVLADNPSDAALRREILSLADQYKLEYTRKMVKK